MFDKLGKKLLGNEEERAVSPVIGAILMVAISVILAAVIAAFVLDMGDSIDEEANAGVQMDFSDDEMDITVTSSGNAADFFIAGTIASESEQDSANESLSGSGDAVTLVEDGEDGLDVLDSDGGSITVVAVTEGGSETTVASEDYEFEE